MIAVNDVSVRLDCPSYKSDHVVGRNQFFLIVNFESNFPRIQAKKSTRIILSLSQILSFS